MRVIKEEMEWFMRVCGRLWRICCLRVGLCELRSMCLMWIGAEERRGG